MLCCSAGPMLPGNSVAQDPRLSLDEPYRHIVLRADSLARSGRLEEGRVALAPWVARASELRPAPRRWVLLTFGVNRIFASDPVPAMTALQEAARVAAAEADTLVLGNSLNWLGISHEMQGRVDRAAAIFDRLLAIAVARREPRLEAAARRGRGYRALLEGRLQPAIDEYSRALVLFARIQDARGELFALTGLGRAWSGLGDAGRADSCNAEVARRARELGNADLEGDALNNLGTSKWWQGDPGLAVELFRRAFELQERRDNVRGMVISASNIAMAQNYLGQFDDAATTLEGMLRTCEERGMVDLQGMLWNQFGNVRMAQGRLHEAAGHFRRSLALGEVVGWEGRLEGVCSLAQALTEMDSAAAAVELLRERVDPIVSRASLATRIEADRLSAEALFRLGRWKESLDRLRRADLAARQAGGTDLRLGPLTLAARCYRALGREDSALAVLKRAAAIQETRRGIRSDPEWREQLGAIQRRLYADLAASLLADTLDRVPAECIQNAFDALQQFKARTLHERMLGPGTHASEARPLEAMRPITLDLLQERVLERGELFLDAFLGPDTSFLFVVTRAECRVVRLPGSDRGLEPQLRFFHALAASAPGSDTPERDHGFLERAQRSLGAMFLGPVADLVRASHRVIVAPDAMLNLVPFAVLTVPFTEAPLLAHCEVVNVPSATLLATLRSRPPLEPRAGARVLAVAGGAAIPGRSLRGAEREVRWLNEQFSNVDARSGPVALHLVAQDLIGYEVLHMAAHTVVDDQHPWRSGIVMASGANPPEFLRASAIARLRLPARMVVLSGCTSAGGRVLYGEGVLGLTGAFVSAGVPTLAATLWPVSDRITARLMQDFYRGLARGETAARAMRFAQLAVRDDPRTSHPFYWSGFVLLGDGNLRIRLARRFPLPQILAGILATVVATIGVIGWRRTRRRLGVRPT